MRYFMRYFALLLALALCACAGQHAGQQQSPSQGGGFQSLSVTCQQIQQDMATGGNQSRHLGFAVPVTEQTLRACGCVEISTLPQGVSVGAAPGGGTYRHLRHWKCSPTPASAQAGSLPGVEALVARPKQCTSTPNFGHGKPYATVKPRTKEELIRLIREDKRGELKVPAAEIMRQVADRLGFPHETWGSQDDFADWLESGNVVTMPCESQSLSRTCISRANSNYTKFDHGWSRNYCEPGEVWLYYKEPSGTLHQFLSTSCSNILREAK